MDWSHARGTVALASPVFSGRQRHVDEARSESLSIVPMPWRVRRAAASCWGSVAGACGVAGSWTLRRHSLLSAWRLAVFSESIDGRGRTLALQSGPASGTVGRAGKNRPLVVTDVNAEITLTALSLVGFLEMRARKHGSNDSRTWS